MHVYSIQIYLQRISNTCTSSTCTLQSGSMVADHLANCGHICTVVLAN